jgi:hypothetical protein
VTAATAVRLYHAHCVQLGDYTPLIGDLLRDIPHLEVQLRQSLYQLRPIHDTLAEHSHSIEVNKPMLCAFL